MEDNDWRHRQNDNHPINVWQRQWLNPETVETRRVVADPVERWQRRWLLGEYVSASSESARWPWWKIVLIAPVFLISAGLVLLLMGSIVAAIVTGESIDPTMTDVFYINDTKTTVVVWECPVDCGELTNSYRLKPGKKKIYQPYDPKHPVPVALLVQDDFGNELGCIQFPQDGKGGNIRFRVSNMVDCSQTATDSAA